MKLNDIDRKYGIVVEASRSRRIIEYDEESMAESEIEEIEVEFSYKKGRKVLRDVLPLSYFIPLYKDAKPIIKRGKSYFHAATGGFAQNEVYEDFDVLRYIEDMMDEEKERTGPMFG